MFKQSALLGLVLVGSSTYPIVMGYDHLYNRKTGTTIDILYDSHNSQKRLSVDDMERLSYEEIKPELYPTEQRVLEAFKVLNTKAPGQVDIVWEQGFNTEGDDSAFLGFPEKLVINRFRNLNVILSDMCRDAFEKLLLKRKFKKRKKSVKGVSFANPLPVATTVLNQIARTYGNGVRQAFVQLRKQMIDDLADRFLKRFKKGKKFKPRDFENGAFNGMADCEMLSNILSSSKKHIIVYCGGWHSEGIRDFLVHYAGFEPVGNQVRERDYEMDPRDLAPLDQQYRTTAWQPSASPTNQRSSQQSSSRDDDESSESSYSRGRDNATDDSYSGSSRNSYGEDSYDYDNYYDDSRSWDESY